ncbi:recombinase family protein [Methylobacterium sp. WL7]|uniref:recombinase family protein n=1 Tax=Methylobacterium sp. WL7 TaxID=2603900 RepID=UPI0011CB046C|nr:recombinase family protein [Methylobacterium sp. WL7]TXN47367.1 recombinase family protein [Methylobacterium sp. WL7]
MARMFFDILAFFAECVSDLTRLRTREGTAIAQSRGRLRGKKPKFTAKLQKELRRMHDTGEYAIGDLAEVFPVSRPTVHGTIARQQIATGRPVSNAP